MIDADEEGRDVAGGSWEVPGQPGNRWGLVEGSGCKLSVGNICPFVHLLHCLQYISRQVINKTTRALDQNVDTAGQIPFSLIIYLKTFEFMPY